MVDSVDLHRPKQKRSRTTEKKILRAAGKLLRSRSLDQISVSEIVEASGVSVGGYYARFPSKESLLSALYDDCVSKATKTVDEFMNKEAWGKKPIRVFIHAYLETAMQFFCKNRSLVRQVINRAREDRSSLLGKSVQEFNEFAHGQIVSLLKDRSHEIRHDNVEAAALLGIRVVSAALRDFTLFGAKRVKFGSKESSVLLDELSQIFVSYLTCAPGNRD